MVVDLAAASSELTDSQLSDQRGRGSSLPAPVQKKKKNLGKSSDGLVLSCVPTTRLITVARSVGPYPWLAVEQVFTSHPVTMIGGSESCQWQPQIGPHAWSWRGGGVVQ